MTSFNINTSGLKNYFDFLWAMTEKEIKARYKRAVFGFLWVLLNPVLQMLIIGIIFSFFIKIPNYFLFLFTGLLPWTFFSLSLSKATTSIVFERFLLQKAKFPINAIPVSIILSNFVHLIISLILLIFYLIATNALLFPQILLIVPVLTWLLFFSVGLSLLTSTLQVRFRDVNFFIQTLLILWFYATPILYDLRLIPAKFHSLFVLNPLTSIFELFHFSLVDRGLVNSQLILINLLSSVAIFILGVYVYKKQYKYFVDWL